MQVEQSSSLGDGQSLQRMLVMLYQQYRHTIIAYIMLYPVYTIERTLADIMQTSSKHRAGSSS